ncbi:hypothetical protein M0805_007727 [Coniferiporia weirii]|nr:hypothetical protein M0805_007727 [Coniferiporia weirii]
MSLVNSPKVAKKRSVFALIRSLTSSSKKGNYEIHGELGHGTYGKVMRATWYDPALGRKGPAKMVALKIIMRHRLQAAGEEITYVELKYMKNLDHPNIVKLYETFETPSYQYLSFEYLTGGELFDRIYKSNDQFKESDAVRIMKYDTFLKLATSAITHILSVLRGVLQGVEYLHKNDIIHHDIKPENLVFRTKARDSDVVIVDFGMAIKLDYPEQYLSGLFGTFIYLAPEVLCGDDYWKDIDVWAVGVVTHQLLTGLVPFNDEPLESFDLFVDLVMRGEIDFDSEIWAGISDSGMFIFPFYQSKRFVASLLVQSYRRPSAQEALEDPWMTESRPANEPVLRGLRDNFNPKKRWKHAINGAVAARRLWDGGHAAWHGPAKCRIVGRRLPMANCPVPPYSDTDTDTSESEGHWKKRSEPESESRSTPDRKREDAAMTRSVGLTR